jgi:hypothetical protein
MLELIALCKGGRQESSDIKQKGREGGVKPPLPRNCNRNETYRKTAISDQPKHICLAES